jgi:hypothetical protein
MKPKRRKKGNTRKVMRMTILDEWVIQVQGGDPKLKPSRTLIEPVVSFAKKKR